MKLTPVGGTHPRPMWWPQRPCAHRRKEREFTLYDAEEGFLTDGESRRPPLIHLRHGPLPRLTHKPFPRDI